MDLLKILFEKRHPNSCKCAVSGWAYFKKHKTPILFGLVMGLSISIVLNIIENVIVKIALIIYDK